MRTLSYGMRAVNWARDFEESPILDDIPRRVRSLETSYWIWVTVSILVMIIGVVILISASSTKLELIGLFIMLEGFIGMGMHANCANAYLAAYRVIWDSQNRLQQEMNKISSSDL